MTSVIRSSPTPVDADASVYTNRVSSVLASAAKAIAEERASKNRTIGRSITNDRKHRVSNDKPFGNRAMVYSFGLDKVYDQVLGPDAIQRVKFTIHTTPLRPVGLGLPEVAESQFVYIAFTRPRAPGNSHLVLDERFFSNFEDASDMLVDEFIAELTRRNIFEAAGEFEQLFLERSGIGHMKKHAEKVQSGSASRVPCSAHDHSDLRCRGSVFLLPRIV